MLISVGDIISKSVKLCRDNSVLLIKYVALLFVPTLVITFFGYTLGFFMRVTDSFFMGLGLYVIIVTVLSVVAFWVSLGLIKVIATKYQGKETKSIGEDLKTNVSLILPAALVSILTGLAVFGGFLLLIVPGIIFAMWFAFSLYALLLDDKHGTEALKYSKQLVNGRWWAVLWRIIAPAFVFGVIITVAQWIVSKLFGESIIDVFTLTPALIAYSLISVIINMIITPLSTAAPTILYIELKKTPIQSHTPDSVTLPEPPKE